MLGGLLFGDLKRMARGQGTTDSGELGGLLYMPLPPTPAPFVPGAARPGRFANAASAQVQDQSRHLMRNAQAVSPDSPPSPDLPPPAAPVDPPIPRQKPGILNYNNMTVRNPHLRSNLDALRAGLDAEGYANVPLVVTGGESYYDPQRGESISMSNGSVIGGRGAGSWHHVENGARDVDLRRMNIPDDVLRNIIQNYTSFDRMDNNYNDGHWPMK